MIVPCDDPAIYPLDAHRNELAAYPIAIPSPLVMSLLFDKDNTRKLCLDLGIPITPGARLASGDTAQKLVGQFGLPLVINPRQSYWIDRLDVMGKTSIMESKADLEALLVVAFIVWLMVNGQLPNLRSLILLVGGTLILGLLEPLAMLWIWLAVFGGMGTDFAFRLIRR